MTQPKRRLPVVSAQRGAPVVRRRALLGGLIAALMGLCAFWFRKARRVLPGLWLRPPGAVAEHDFLQKCVRCMKCGSACPNQCIEFHGLSSGLDRAFTPYIKPRARACILCGECGKACPTGALTPFVPTREGWLADVKMGTAHVNKEMCFSYNGRTCGACYRACPLAGEAIKIGVFETPIMQPEHCVGCGLCEQACLHLPQAIRVIPAHSLGPMSGGHA